MAKSILSIILLFCSTFLQVLAQEDARVQAIRVKFEENMAGKNMNLQEFSFSCDQDKTQLKVGLKQGEVAYLKISYIQGEQKGEIELYAEGAKLYFAFEKMNYVAYAETNSDTPEMLSTAEETRAYFENGLAFKHLAKKAQSAYPGEPAKELPKKKNEERPLSELRDYTQLYLELVSWYKEKRGKEGYCF